MATVQVLCPNGRRQNVKVTQNTKLLQVLENVCQKQKFLPAEDYKLMHGRTTLDLTLSIMYTNLPNNAKLDLVKTEKTRAESEVIIALQLVSGDRMQHSFSPITSLWDILQYWENLPDSVYKGKLTNVDTSVCPSVQPVCIYMREEVTGEVALKETTLRSLGLIGGKAVLRILHRPVEDKILVKIANKIEKEKSQRMKLEKDAQNVLPAGIQSSSDTSVSSLSAQCISDTTLNSIEMKSEVTGLPVDNNLNTKEYTHSNKTAVDPGKKDPTKINECQKGTERDMPISKVVKMETESNECDELMEVEQSSSVTNELVMDIEENAQSAKDKVEKGSPRSSRAQDKKEIMERLKGIPGIEVFTPGDFNALPPDQQETARGLAQAYLSKMKAPTQIQEQQPEGSGSRDDRQQARTQAAVADFRFPEDTKGKHLYHNERSIVKKEDFKPCERQTVVFNIEESLKQSTVVAGIQEEIPDEFFELTEKDIRSLMTAQQKRLQEMEEQPLMTSTMRKAKIEDEYSQYDRVVIRIHFHDKLVLQGLFKPRETVFAVQKFVKEYLEDKSLPFYLYTSPPKNVLKDESQTLIEARLVPATVVYFGSEQYRDHYLSLAVLSELSPKLKADMVVAECLNAVGDRDVTHQISGSMKKQPAGTRNQQTSSTSATTSSASGSCSSVPATFSDQSDKPKWFKLGKK